MNAVPLSADFATRSVVTGDIRQCGTAAAAAAAYRFAMEVAKKVVFFNRLSSRTETTVRPIELRAASPS